MLNGTEVDTGAMKTEGSLFICLRRARSSKLVYYFYFSSARFLLIQSFFVHFLLAQSSCSFLLLPQKKRTKEKGSRKSFLGLPFYRLPTHYNSFAMLTQTVMLTYILPFATSKMLIFSKKDLKAFLALRRLWFSGLPSRLKY